MFNKLFFINLIGHTSALLIMNLHAFVAVKTFALVNVIFHGVSSTSRWRGQYNLVTFIGFPLSHHHICTWCKPNSKG